MVKMRNEKNYFSIIINTPSHLEYWISKANTLFQKICFEISVVLVNRS